MTCKIKKEELKCKYWCMGCQTGDCPLHEQITALKKRVKELETKYETGNNTKKRP